MTDPRVYEVQIVLCDGDFETVLTPEQARLVIDTFEAVRHEATKWRLMTQRAGCLLLIDTRLVAEIKDFLANGRGRG